MTWVGPSPNVLKSISSKSYCREIADSVNVPVIPGTLGIVDSPAAVVDFGNTNGWPVFLKLDKGGGGKGIERVGSEDEAVEVLERATRIGEMAFGSGDCYIETVVNNPRHIEVQPGLTLKLNELIGVHICQLDKGQRILIGEIGRKGIKRAALIEQPFSGFGANELIESFDDGFDACPGEVPFVNVLK